VQCGRQRHGRSLGREDLFQATRLQGSVAWCEAVRLGMCCHGAGFNAMLLNHAGLEGCPAGLFCIFNPWLQCFTMSINEPQLTMIAVRVGEAHS